MISIEPVRKSKHQFNSVQSLCHVRLFVTPWIAARQASLSITNSRSLLRLTSIESVMPSSHLILLSPSPPAFNPSQHQSLFQWVNSSHEVAKILEFQLQHHSFQRNTRVDLLQNGLVGSPCSPRDSQESSPTLQFKSISSLVFSFLYSPTLTSIHDYWKKHSFSSKKQASFNFMAAVTICSDFGAPQNSLSLFPLFPHIFAMKWWD